MDRLIEIAGRFRLGEKPVAVKPLGEGFINDTYMVYTGSEVPQYILQRKNHLIFTDIPAMMDNIVRVSAHIATKVADPGRQSLSVVPALDGNPFWRDGDGNWWTVCRFIRGSWSYDRADSPSLAYLGGRGLGKFHRQVADFNEPLAETIKGFHDIRFRFEQWDASLSRDAAGRVGQLREEISWIESRRERMLAFREKYEKGIIPSRVTHNDTKISNFLFDADSGELLCAIDLDTLMRSTLLNDTGDALRSYTNTGAEDDRNPDNVSMDMDMFKSYMDGYLEEASGILTEQERENLAFSGLYITYEQVLRFLMDYIDGDVYYKTAYAEHNLVRTRAQYRLLQSMEEKLTMMEDYICQL